MLSSDGIRKCCATDADFLTLTAHLAALPVGEPERLASALDQISREGSGDDVSVAIAQLGAPPPEWKAATPPPAGPAAAPLPLELQAQLRRSIAQLCTSPASIRASLRQRQSQITGLATGQLQARQLQRNAATDPLGGLLGTAFLARGPAAAPGPLRALGACPELEAALAATWPAGPADRRMGPLPAQAGPTGSSRPTAPPP